jgi:hypothetical protein
MSQVFEKLKEKTIEKANGVGLSVVSILISKYAVENIPQVHRFSGTLKTGTYGVIPLVVGAVGTYMDVKGADDTLSFGLARTLEGLADFYVLKKPFCYAKDGSTIECYNLDANVPVKVYVDGREITFTEAPTTDGSGKVTITLPSEMSSGVHNVVVIAKEKAFYGVVAV